MVCFSWVANLYSGVSFVRVLIPPRFGAHLTAPVFFHCTINFSLKDYRNNDRNIWSWVQFVSPVNLSQRYHRYRETKSVGERSWEKTNARILEWFNLLGGMRKTRESKLHKIKYVVCRKTWTKENWIWRKLWTDEVIDDGPIFFWLVSWPTLCKNIKSLERIRV